MGAGQIVATLKSRKSNCESAKIWGNGENKI